MTKEFLEKVYAILVELGGATLDGWQKDAFIQAHLDKEYPCQEWRFGGRLGFGGKYYSRENRVDCYIEDYKGARRDLIAQINTKLKSLKDEINCG